jgi:tetratricopeptide (TPR) repeat protein
VLAGRWAQAAEQNERAIAADGDYRKVRPKIGFYRLYMAHNNHMLSFASMMEGRSQVAVQSARDAIAGVPEDYLKQNTALMDPFMGVVYDALKRFGKWDEILAEPAPPEFLPITTAMWRFHRGLAHAAKGDMEAAEKEKLAFAEAKAKVPEGALLMINPASKTLQIAEHMLEGEIALARKDYDTAVAQLRKAVEIEDSLMYMEPPEWVQPVRHTLGAVLIEAGKFDEAAEVYRQDLTKWPNNGWSLYGLTRCQEAKGAADQAQATRTQFNKAWSRADTKIGASCLCVQKPT